MTNVTMVHEIQRAWERRAIASYWRELATDRYRDERSEDARAELIEAIAAHEVESATFDALTRNVGVGRIASIERGLS